MDQQRQTNDVKEEAAQEVTEELTNKDEQTEHADPEAMQDETIDAKAEAQNESSGSTSSDEIDKLEQEISALKSQLEEQQQRMLRIQADYDNFRRRTREEKEQMRTYASLPLLENLLPFIDNFERAMASSKEHPDFDSLMKGLEMIYDQLQNILEQEGLKVIDAVGHPFNPEFHQAVMQVEDDEYGEGIIVEQLQKGYQLKEKVIRPSMVKVNK